MNLLMNYVLESFEIDASSDRGIGCGALWASNIIVVMFYDLLFWYMTEQSKYFIPV